MRMSAWAVRCAARPRATILWVATSACVRQASTSSRAAVGARTLMSAACLTTPALTDAPTRTVVTFVVAPGVSTEQDRGKTETTNPAPLSQFKFTQTSTLTRFGKFRYNEFLM